MAAPKNNLGGRGGLKSAQVARTGTSATAVGTDAPPAAPSTATGMAASSFVTTEDLSAFTPSLPCSAPAGSSVEALKQFAAGKAREANLAGRRLSLLARGLKAQDPKVIEAQELKTRLDDEAVLAQGVADEAHRQAKADVVKAEAADKQRDAELYAGRKALFHTASEGLMGAKGAMETQFTAVEATMKEKRAEVLQVQARLARAFNAADWPAFEAAVKDVDAIVAEQGEDEGDGE